MSAVAAVEVDGRPILLSGGRDGKIRRWDLGQGTLVGEECAHAGGVSSLAVIEGGGTPIAFSGGIDGRILRWDVSTGEQVGAPLLLSNLPVVAVTAARVGGVVIVAGEQDDGTIAWWDAGTGESLGKPRGYQAGGTGGLAIVEVERGTALAAGSRQIGSITCWLLPDGEFLGQTLRVHGDGIRSIASVPRDCGGGLISAGLDGSIVRWDARLDHTPFEALPGLHTGPINSVAVGMDSGVLIALTASEDGTVRRWDLAGHTPPGEPLIRQASAIGAVTLASAAGKRIIISGGVDGAIRRWNLVDGSSMGPPLLGHSGAVTALAGVDIQGQPSVVCGGRDGTVRHCSLKGAVLASPIDIGPEFVRALAVAKVDGRHEVIAGGSELSFRRWDLATGAHVGDLATPYGGSVRTLAVMEVDDTSMLVAGGSYGVTMQDMRELSAEHVPWGVTTEAWSAATARLGDGTIVVAATGANGVVRVMQLGTPGVSEAIGDYEEGRPAGPWSLALTELDGRLVALVGGPDGRVDVWRVPDGQHLQTATIGAAVTCLTSLMIRASTFVLAGGSDGAIYCWNVATGEPIGEPVHAHWGGVTALVPAELSGQPVVVSAGEDGDLAIHSAEMWPVSHGAFSAGALADSMTVEDHLGHEALAEAIARFIINTSSATSLTIAVRGDWGAGKSSLMAAIRDRLDPVEMGEDRVAGRRRPIDMVGAPVTHARFSIRQLRELLNLPRASLAKVAPSELKQPVERVTVWFNPWAYQTGEQLWTGLAHEIITQVTQRFPVVQREWFFARLNLLRVDRAAVGRHLLGLVWERASKPALGLAAALLAVAVPAVLKLLAHAPDTVVAVSAPLALITGGAGVGAIQGWLALRSDDASKFFSWLTDAPVASEVHSAADRSTGFKQETWSVGTDPQYRARTGYVYLIRNDLEKVLNLVATKDRPLVVFIDDLDRCAPQVVVEMLEAINLFLAGELPNCVFLLGIEPNVLTAHVELTYQDLIERLKQRLPAGDQADLGRRFLDKFVQLSVSIPRPTAARIETLLDAVIGRPEARIRWPHVQPRPAAVATPDQIARRALQSSERLVDQTASVGREVSSGVAGTGSDEQVAAAATRELIAQRLDAPGGSPLALERDPDVNRILREVVAALSSTYPRDVKRFLNLFRFYAYLANARGLLGSDVLDGIESVALLAQLLVHAPTEADMEAFLDERPKVAAIAKALL